MTQISMSDQQKRKNGLSVTKILRHQDKIKKTSLHQIQIQQSQTHGNATGKTAERHLAKPSIMQI